MEVTEVEEADEEGDEGTMIGSGNPPAGAPDPAHPKPEVWSAVLGFLMALCRAFLVLVLVILAAGVGLLPPIGLRYWIAALPPAGLAVSAAVLLGVFKGAFQTLPTAWDFIVSAKTETLGKIFSQVAIVGLGLGFAWFAVPAAEHEESGRVLNLSLAGTPPPLVMNESDALLTTFIVFPEDALVLPDKDPQFALVNNLVDSLLTCLRTPTDQVNVVVRAYASSSGTDALNIALYKGRASYVATLIKDQVAHAGKTGQFSVDIREWRSLKAMELRRLFTDTDESGVYQNTAGALNRRAEIKVHSAGSCLPG